MKTFDNFCSLLKPDWKVLDLGAGEGKQAKKMIELGAKVVAVDSKTPMDMDTAISWNIFPIQEWVVTIPEGEIFNAILMRNSLQFLKKDFVKKELFPILFNHLKSGGLFAIETFYKDPEPSFANPFWSYWTEEDLKSIFSDWDVIESQTVKENTPDLSGKLRDFYKTGFLARKI